MGKLRFYLGMILIHVGILILTIQAAAGKSFEMYLIIILTGQIVAVTFNLGTGGYKYKSQNMKKVKSNG